jgi:hypothetical protein
LNQVKDIEISKSEELIIYKFDDRQSQEPVMFGHSVCFQTPDGFFLAFKGNGEMRVEKNQRFEDTSNSIARLTKWTIHDVRNMTNRDKVTPLNDVCFKSPFGDYLKVSDDFLLSANGQEISDQCSFKIVKATVPLMPDWLHKRPFLKHNYITSDY